MKSFISSKYTVLMLSVFGAMGVAHANYLTNFGDPNTAHLVQALQNGSVHIVQLGDSHTAGDTMTDALRERLQNELGDGGMGWAMPMYFKGQRMARFGYDNTDFNPITSRTTKDENYTLGGLLATPKVNGATLTLKAKRSEPAQNITLSIRQNAHDDKFVATDAMGQRFEIQAPIKNNTWQNITLPQVRLPLTLTNDNATGSAIGSWWAFNPNGRGAVVSALGINGAQLSQWKRWNTQAWQQELSVIRPTVVALAYGTNEGYNSIAGEQVKKELTERIRQIRQAVPNAVILIISAPEALKGTGGSCGTRPQTLSDVQLAQSQVAQAERTLHWDWQGAMGGSCSMKSWMNQGLATKDGVHFSSKGYTKLGQQLASDLLALRTGDTTHGQNNAVPATSIAPITHVDGGVHIERSYSKAP